MVTYRTSVTTLTQTYTAAESRLAGGSLSAAGRELVDRGSEEAANSVYLLNAMDGDGAAEDDPTEEELRGTSMQVELATFGQDLVDRCVRVVAVVTAADPACDKTDKGVPTRRSKVRYLLRRKGIDEKSLEDLVEVDMENVLTLFRDFNNGTHGHAGRFTITQLNAIRIRVESAIGFIHTLCAA